MKLIKLATTEFVCSLYKLHTPTAAYALVYKLYLMVSQTNIASSIFRKVLI